ncbi:uncharacterized protein LOC117118892 [Anneissia japonica]|uniref:uncharacterized protein LOC117118892 n=1 Tax=Anneissia japonica TaxID=1529436 RepID=UPI001425532A|nr:uncharacterized protein LOC117118892 [Anneissia japonica]
MKDPEFLSMLVQLSEAISKKGEKYLDLFRVLYRDLVNVKSDLENAKCAFDLFQALIASGILKPTDISVLFETIELTGLKYLIEIIKTYETYPDEVKITRFTPHRQQVVALGKDFSVKDLQKVGQLYEGNFSNPWKLIQHLEDASVLTENSISSFIQRLNKNKVNEDFNQLLVTISDAIIMKGEKYVDMLRVLYKDLAEIKTELEEAKSAFDLFQILRVADVLKATDISILFETIEVTGLRYLKEIIKTYDTYPDKVKIMQFSAHRQQVIALGKDFSTIDIQRIGRKYEVPDDFCSNPWKLITFLESNGIVSEGNLSSFLMNLQRVGNEIASTSKRPNLDKGIGEASIPKRPKLDKDKSRELEQSKRSLSDENLIIKGSLMKRQKELYKNENRMTPAIWHKGHKVDIAKVFTELKLLQSKKKEDKDKSTCTAKEGRPTSLTEALGVIKSSDSCKVLITGKGGMGKTTLLKYIAHQWATDDGHVFADKLLFLINIREIKASKTFLDIIMNKIDCKAVIHKNNFSCDSVERFLVTHDDEIVILLDGYDELERNAKDPIDLFKRSELGESSVVITSRPDNTADLVECCDVHIEVKGFSSSNIKKYIQNHFHSICEVRIGNSLIKEFGLDLKYTSDCGGGNHKEAFELCSSPLLLLQICTIWKLKRVLPTYLPDLFKELICCILNQYLNRAGNKSVIANFERIPDQYISAFLILGECMYEGLKKNILSIDKYDLSKMAKNKELLNLALEFGVVYEDTPVDPGDVREMYTPPHKLMSEALAGLYLSTEIQKGSSKVEYDKIRCNDYLNMTRVFAVGFLGADADKMLKPWLIIRPSNYRSIVQCLEHVKKKHEDDVLKKLDEHMSNDMKAYNKQMWESFRSLLNDDRDTLSMHLFKLMERCCKKYDVYSLQDAAISLISRCTEMQCRIVAHTLVLLDVIDWHSKPKKLLRCITTWQDEEIDLLSAEMKKNHYKYPHYFLEINCKFSSAFLIHFLKYASDLNDLLIPITPSLVTILNTVINDLYTANIKLNLRTLDLHGNDLNDIDGRLLGKLFKIAPKLKYLGVSKCRLSGGILRAMITECQNSEGTVNIPDLGYNEKMNNLKKFPKLSYLDINNCSSSGSINEITEDCGRMNVVLKDSKLNLQGNNLSDIDGKSLAELVRVIHYDDENIIFSWRNYSLTADNLVKLVESVGENITFNWKMIDLTKVNLSPVSGITLARLFKNSPDLKHIDMTYCSLSGSIVNEMMEECRRMNVVLEDIRLSLQGNDLSDIDGKSLADLVKVTIKPYQTFIWSDYFLTVDNLEKLVKSIGENITLNWERIDFDRINLSSISGRTLACLVKISPYLIHIDMSYCSLSGRIVNEMMEECCRMNVVLKNNMLSLEGNDLSDIDGKLLAELVNVIDQPYGTFC